MALEHLQGRRLHSLLGQSVPMPSHPQGKKCPSWAEVQVELHSNGTGQSESAQNTKTQSFNGIEEKNSLKFLLQDLREHLCGSGTDPDFPRNAFLLPGDLCVF